MRLSRAFLALPLFTLLAAVPATADAAPKAAKAAKETPLLTIEATGIAEFDDVFMKAKAIHDTLDAQDKNLTEARNALVTALGVATDAPLATAFADLKTKANGKLKLAMKGKTPRLEASDAIPDNVQAGIDAVNKLLDASESAIAAGVGLVPQSKELVAACSAFPAKLTSMGLEPMKLMDASKKVTNNVKATGATPERVDKLVKTSEGIFTDVTGAFGG
jgi:hypothetical protein